MDQKETKTELELLYDEVSCREEIKVDFKPMIPKLYELLLPSVESKLNFINVAYRNIAFYRCEYSAESQCSHSEILSEKVKMLNSILNKLLNVSGILDDYDSLNKE